MYSSKKAAAAAYNIPRSIFIDRINDRTNARASHANQQRLTPLQEEFLADWILEEDARGYPPSHARAREMAIRVLRMNGDTNPLGHKWTAKFVARNPRVASVVGRPIEACRIRCTDQASIQRFFALFQRVQTEHDVRHEDTWNMDETGIGLGICTNTQVLASSRSTCAYVKSPEDREWVSIVETVSVAGRKIRPLVIFRGSDPQSTWFQCDKIPDWVYTTSENGWTSNRIALGWLQTIFLPETKPDTDRARILLMDGHGSHMSTEFLWVCKQNRVQLVFLPPHSSHVLQPLDLSCFSPLKTRYRQLIAELAALDDSAPVKKKRFTKCCHLARNESLTERVIRGGWKAAGLCPWNPQKVLSSSQVQQPHTPTPTTPPNLKHILPDDIETLQTPQKPQHIHQATQSISKRQKIDRDTRNLLQKVGKSIGRLNTIQAGYEATIQQQEAQLEALAAKKPRKEVVVDPNTRFAEIGSIREAI